MANLDIFDQTGRCGSSRPKKSHLHSLQHRHAMGGIEATGSPSAIESRKLSQKILWPSSELGASISDAQKPAHFSRTSDVSAHPAQRLSERAGDQKEATSERWDFPIPYR